MKEDEFIKKFPSFKDGYYILRSNCNKYISEEGIEEHCLDKKIVKEIIDEQWDSNKEIPAIDGNYIDLIKKLGLEEY